jgi:hypothetical protein
VRFLGAGQALRDAIGVPVPGYERVSYYDRALASVRQALSEPAFLAAWQAGQAAGPEFIIKEALHTSL